jgi:hypothetical protein
MRFLCSKGIGTGAKHLLTNPEKLRQGLIAHWKDNVRDKITDTGSARRCRGQRRWISQAAKGDALYKGPERQSGGSSPRASSGSAL